MGTLWGAPVPSPYLSQDPLDLCVVALGGSSRGGVCVSKPIALLKPFLHLQGKEGRGQERGLSPRVSTLQQVRDVSLLCTRSAP